MHPKNGRSRANGVCAPFLFVCFCVGSRSADKTLCRVLSIGRERAQKVSSGTRITRCRSPPAAGLELRFQTDWRKRRWHITIERQNWNGLTGKRKKKNNCRELGVSEDVIQRLHTYDWQQFKAERNFYEWQSFTDEDVEEIPETAARRTKKY